LPLKICIDNVEEEFLLLQVEYITHTLVEPALKIPVNIQAKSTLQRASFVIFPQSNRLALPAPCPP
jgi:hypothetical protein